ncbi:isopenicillin N synthase family dioxygenase [Naumannella halotolerans]|uniref:isopenicillin N synthase family dioxygenase n=1 Tax=Naumannella halotolerans TaxID=993414 RepID=UPI00370D1141
MSALPFIDLSQLDSDPEAFLAELRRITHEVGFFYLTGHGVPQELIDQVLEVSRRFFALPEADKLAIENVNSPQFRGYARFGNELTNGQTDWREQVDIGPEREPVPPGEDVPDFARLEGPNQWPEALPEFRTAFERWHDELHAVGLKLMRAWASALGVDSAVFDEAFATAPFPLIKVVRYPGTSDPEPKQGVGAHRDGGVLTLLLVEPGKGGLQVERDGEWVEAIGIEGTFIVNIGEMLELATGGYLKATMHRVISPPVGSERISVPFFFNPALTATMPTLELPAELAARARGVTADPTDSPILQLYGENVLRYRLRAHPDVAEIHHPELLASRS